jgi:formiminotetrahydrofolate cyclodeaminase
MPEETKPYVDRPMREYLEDAAAGRPTPGGGSVSALAGALGTTMASMAANFTVGKKKFKDVEPEVNELLGRLDGERRRLLDAVQRDTEAYAAVGAAYSMPKATDEEKAARRGAIQEALKTAMGPPLEALRACLAATEATRRLLDRANPNLITDVGVAAVLLEAASRGAHVNVAVNLKGMKDAALVERTSAECRKARGRITALAAEVMKGVSERLGGGES